MHTIDVYNMYRDEWQRHEARRVEIRPHTTRANATEVILFKTRSDEGVVITTQDPVEINTVPVERPDGW